MPGNDGEVSLTCLSRGVSTVAADEGGIVDASMEDTAFAVGAREGRPSTGVIDDESLVLVGIGDVGLAGMSWCESGVE